MVLLLVNPLRPLVLLLAFLDVKIRSCIIIRRLKGQPMKTCMRVVFCLEVLLIGIAAPDVEAALSQEVKDILKAVAREESKLISLQAVQTEHRTNKRDPNADVTRTYAYEEQAGSYRFSIQYPGLSSRPPVKRMGPGTTHAYIPCETAFDGKIMTHYIPSLKAGFVNTRRTPGQVDSYPVNNHRPYWPYNECTLYELLNTLVNKPDASVGVKHVTGNMVEVAVDSGKRRVVFRLDPSKGYALAHLDSYYKGRLTDHRVFGKYVQKEGVWLAQETRVEMYRSEDGTLGRAMLYKIEDGWVVNKPIPPERFRLVFPPGTFVRDLRDGRSYSIEHTTQNGEACHIETAAVNAVEPYRVGIDDWVVNEAWTDASPPPAQRGARPTAAAVATRSDARAG